MRKKMRHAMLNLIQYLPVKVSVRKRISCFGNSCKVTRRHLTHIRKNQMHLPRLRG